MVCGENAYIIKIEWSIFYLLQLRFCTSAPISKTSLLNSSGTFVLSWYKCTVKVDSCDEFLGIL